MSRQTRGKGYRQNCVQGILTNGIFYNKFHCHNRKGIPKTDFKKDLTIQGKTGNEIVNESQNT